MVAFAFLAAAAIAVIFAVCAVVPRSPMVNVLSLVVMFFAMAAIFALIMLLRASPTGSELMTLYARMDDVSRSTVESVITVAFVITTASFLFSLALLISLYLRWKPAYYIFVASGALSLFWSLMGIILSFNPPAEEGVLSMVGGGNLYCAGLNVIMAGINLWLVFQMQDDFAHDEIRILFRPDSSAV